MHAFLSCLLGYVIGCVNPAYILSRIKREDIRDVGSHNAGASNVVITYGKTAGIVVALFDIFKAFAATKLAVCLFPNFAYAFVLSGTFCIIGHVFPCWMKFRGGKGLAVLAGMVLSYDWRVFLIFLAIEAVLAFSTDYICVVPVTASVAFWVVLVFRSIPCGMLFMIAVLIIFGKHMENFQRIRIGTEIRISYLWKGEAELNRVHNKKKEE